MCCTLIAELATSIFLGGGLPPASTDGGCSHLDHHGAMLDKQQPMQDHISSLLPRWVGGHRAAMCASTWGVQGVGHLSRDHMGSLGTVDAKEGEA